MTNKHFSSKLPKSSQPDDSKKRVRRTAFPAAVALWTALTLAGGIYVEFFLIIDVLGVPAMTGPLIEQILTSFLAFPVPFISGLLWGAGLAMLTGRAIWPLAKRGLISWGLTVVVGGILIDFTQIPVFAAVPQLRFIPNITHWLFTLVFTPSIGFIVWWNVRRMLNAMGAGGVESAGRWSGAAAAGAFFIASLVLLYGFGWEVAGPFAGRAYNMIDIMHVGNFAAALAGGAVFGTNLRRSPIED